MTKNNSDAQVVCFVVAGAAATAAALLLTRKLRGPESRAPPVSHPGWLGVLWNLKGIVEFGYMPYVAKRAKELNSPVIALNMWPLGPLNVFVESTEGAHVVMAAESRLELAPTTPPSYKGLHGADFHVLAGRQHKLWRKTFAGAFQPRALSGYLPKYTRSFEAMWGELAQHRGGEEVAFRPFMRRALLQVSLNTFFGVWLERDSEELMQFDVDLETDEAAWSIFVCHNLPGSPYRRAWLAVQRIQAFIRSRVRVEAARSCDKEQQAAADAAGEPPSSRPLRNTIEAVVEERASSDPDVRAAVGNESLVVSNLHLLLVASLGTVNYTSTALMALIHQDCNKASLERLRAEVVPSAAGDVKRPIALADLEKLPFANACIDETVRLFPLVAGSPRELPRGQQMEVCGVVIRGPCAVHPSFACDLLKPELFPRPEEFLPERWLEDGPDELRASAEARRASNPFGLGPHHCIGMPLARLLLKLVLVTYVRGGYVMELAGPVEKQYNLFPAVKVANDLVARFSCP